LARCKTGDCEEDFDISDLQNAICVI